MVTPLLCRTCHSGASPGLKMWGVRGQQAEPLKGVWSIGAGAIELAGARAPKFLTAGARGNNRIYGAPVKN